MNTIAQLIAAAAIAGAAPTGATDADLPEFDATTIAACTLEGAAEWRAQLPELSPDAEEIMALERRACHMIASRQIEAMVDEIIVEDSLILLDGAGLAAGPDQQHALFEMFLGAGYDLVFEPVYARIAESGEMAWAIGLVKITTPDGEIQWSKYTSIWQNSDGHWRNAIEMRNSNGALGPRPYETTETE